MSTSKKRKSSGQRELELDDILTRLQKLRLFAIAEEEPGSDPTPFIDHLDSMIATVKSQINTPLSLSFSAADDKHLQRFNITQMGMLILHPEATLCKAITTSQTISSDGLWSNDNMYKHLFFLASSITNINETSSRMVIDTFFFRSIAMVLFPQKVIVMLEKQIPVVHPRLSQMDTISGIIDYTAIVTNSTIAKHFIRFPRTLDRSYGDKVIVFFAAEAKASASPFPLEQHLPQVLLELVACMKRLEKSHIRGALMTSFQWYFIVVDLDDKGDGVKYWVSNLIEWKTKQISTSSPGLFEEIEFSEEFDPALIASILSSWIPESFTEFNGDRWFYLEPEGGV